VPRIASQPAPAGRATLEIVRRPHQRGLADGRVRAVLEAVLSDRGRPAGGVTVLFTDDAEMRALNRRFRRRDRATDVLSFPWQGARGEGYLGDIAISVPTARKYASRADWRIGEELEFLLIHALLHLLGHDHETDGGEMHRIQARLARKILGREIPEVRVHAMDRPGAHARGRRRKT